MRIETIHKKTLTIHFSDEFYNLFCECFCSCWIVVLCLIYIWLLCGNFHRKRFSIRNIYKQKSLWLFSIATGNSLMITLFLEFQTNFLRMRVIETVSVGFGTLHLSVFEDSRIKLSEVLMTIHKLTLIGSSNGSESILRIVIVYQGKLLWIVVTTKS